MTSVSKFLLTSCLGSWLPRWVAPESREDTEGSLDPGLACVRRMRCWGMQCGRSHSPCASGPVRWLPVLCTATYPTPGPGHSLPAALIALHKARLREGSGCWGPQDRLQVAQEEVKLGAIVGPEPL